MLRVRRRRRRGEVRHGNRGTQFSEALKLLAERNGIPMPKRSQYADEDSRLRGAVFQIQELAQESSARNLDSPAGEAARGYLARRGVTPETAEQFGWDTRNDRDARCCASSNAEGSPPRRWSKSGADGKRQDGSFYDRFRNRLMFRFITNRAR